MRITVKTGCRLHLGFLDLTGDLGRLYGSIGVCLENPGTVITAEKSRQLIVEHSNNSEKIILDAVTRFSRHYRLQPATKIHLVDGIPKHSGLGSGTQLALAVATALAKIFDIDASVREMSVIMDRGKRSGVGIACFEAGGFIVDSGRRNAGRNAVAGPPSVIFRRDFPEDWCFVIVIPEAGKGLSGKDEDYAMSSLNPSGRISEEICRLTQMKLLPALIDRDIVEFGEAITEIDRRTGMYFERTQGGIYKEAITQDLIGFMFECGVYGVGQSSWGPTVYGLAQEDGAQAVADRVRNFLAEKKMGCEAFVSRCRNRGAEITVSDR
jgi:beta-RFAP synthase